VSQPRVRGPYTPEEDALIERAYATRGTDYLSKRLHRSRECIMKRARKLGVDAYTPPEGWVTTTYVGWSADRATDTVARAARRAGVLKHLRRVGIVPEAWANEYTRRRHLEEPARARTREGHLTLTQAARVLGVDPSGLSKALARKSGPLYQCLAGVTVITGGCGGHRNRYALPAWQVEQAAARLRRQQEARGLVSVKALAEREGVTVTAIHRRYQGRTTYALRGGRKVAFVPAPSEEAA
jgi:hypothetical protein